MAKEYVFYIMLDGPICGIAEGSVHTAENPNEDAWHGVLNEMAYDHVSSYMSIEEYEEESGCDIELDARAEAWDNERHPQCINGISFYSQILDNMKQDEKGRWYVEVEDAK